MLLKIGAKYFRFGEALCSCIFVLNLIPITNSLDSVRNAPWPPTRLVAASRPIRGEHISLGFYVAVGRAATSKSKVQFALHNFLENLQRNLTTSNVLNNNVHKLAFNKTELQVHKLRDLMVFFHDASVAAGKFANDGEYFFDSTINESSELLRKLRQVPTAQRYLSNDVKSKLTDYFAEMEFIHIMFSEIIDQALEFIVDTMRSMQQTFSRFGDLQSELLAEWKFTCDERCCNYYMEFLQQWAVQVFQCSAGPELNIAYDVYAMTEVTTVHILRELEFRIQRLFNCFLFGSHEIRCRFLNNPEQDFEKLHSKLEELQVYYDIKIKRGKVSNIRQRRRRELETNHADYWDRCIPYGFPVDQISPSYRSCFRLFNQLHS